MKEQLPFIVNIKRSLKYKNGNSIYNIKVNNPKGKTNTVETFKLNGKIINEKEITIDKNGGIYNIEIEM